MINQHHRFVLVEMKRLADSGKKIAIVNIEYASPENQRFAHNEFNIKHFGSKNYKKECFKQMIPYQKYSLIKDETDGGVMDGHTGKVGHTQLAKQLIDLIENKKPTI